MAPKTALRPSGMMRGLAASKALHDTPVACRQAHFIANLIMINCRMWDLSSGVCNFSLEGHTARCPSFTGSILPCPTGSIVATCSKDSTARWEHSICRHSVKQRSCIGNCTASRRVAPSDVIQSGLSSRLFFSVYQHSP